MPLFKSPPYDKHADANATSAAALATFEDVVVDLEHANVLLSEVESEARADALAALAKANEAQSTREKNTRVAGRIRTFLDGE